jgi:hypothetical protein
MIRHARSVLLLSVMTSFASAAEPQKAYQLAVEFKFAAAGKTTQTRNEFMVAEGSRDWLVLSDLKNGILLLGRLTKEGFTNLELEYAIVNTNAKPNDIISLPSSAVTFGQSNEINVKGVKSETISLNVRAKQTEVPPKK